MNFLQFLEQNINTDDTESKITIIKPKKKEKPIDTPLKDTQLKDTSLKVTPPKGTTIKSLFNNNRNLKQYDYDNYSKFKKGDLVIINYLPNSPLNIYKGYFGEIKEHIPHNESAYVMLEAMNYPKHINFPLKHLMHRY
jgi:ribosomal protein L21E